MSFAEAVSIFAVIALVPLSIYGAYEDYRKWEISRATNAVLLFLLMVSIGVVLAENPALALGLVAEWAFLSGISGVGGADARFAVAQASALAYFLGYHALLYPILALGFYAFLPDRLLLGALLSRRVAVAAVPLVILCLLFPDIALYFVAVIVLFISSLKAAGSLYMKPVVALEAGDWLAESISTSGERTAHHRLAYERYPWLTQIPALLSVPVAMVLGRRIAKRLGKERIPEALTDENLTEVKERLTSLGIDAVLVYGRVQALTCSIVPFYLLSLVVILLYRLSGSWLV